LVIARNLKFTDFNKDDLKELIFTHRHAKFIKVEGGGMRSTLTREGVIMYILEVTDQEDLGTGN